MAERHLKVDMRASIAGDITVLDCVVTQKTPPPPDELMWSSSGPELVHITGPNLEGCLRTLAEMLDPQPPKPGDAVVTEVDHEAKTITIGTHPGEGDG